MNGLPQPSYAMSEPHLSGYRVIIGYETLSDAQAAQAALCKPQAREDGGDRPIEASWTDGVTHAYVNLSAALSAERQAWRQKLGIRIASVRYLDVEVPPAREDAQPVAWRVTNKATGHDELFWKPLADLPFNRERFSTEPLYTHPAPDALREDSQAWGMLADLVSWFTKPVQGQNGMVWVIPAGDQGADDAVAAALAALQAEQKGGAVDGPEDDELPGDFLARVGMDGALWADGFRKMALKLGYSDMDEGWLIGWFCNAVMAGYDHAQRRFDPALATREEAPAEVGVQETLRVLLDNLVIAQSLSKELRQRATDEARSYLSALRAQPQAREDAQPVAWRMTGRDGSTISLQAEPYHGGFAHMMEADVGCTVQPLYTHPATDAQPFGYWVEHKSAENPVLIRYGSFVPASDHYKITALYTTPPAPDEIKAAYQRGWGDRESDIIERAERIAPQPDALAVLDRLLTHSGARGTFDAMKHGDAVKDAEALIASSPAPDALRVAVEALEAIEQIRSEMAMVPIDSEAANAWANALERAADMAAEALAALQQDALSAAPGEAVE